MFSRSYNKWIAANDISFCRSFHSESIYLQSHAFPVDQPPENMQWWALSINYRLFQYTHPVMLEKWLQMYLIWKRFSPSSIRIILSPNQTVSVWTWIQAMKWTILMNAWLRAPAEATFPNSVNYPNHNFRILQWIDRARTDLSSDCSVDVVCLMEQLENIL